MSVVTDQDLIAELNAKKKASISGKTTATDPALIAELNEKASAQRLEAAKSSSEAKAPAVPEGSVIGDFLRVSGSLGSSIAAEPLSGLYGLAKMIGTGGDSERAAQAVEDAREGLTYTPDTEGSQEMLQDVGEVLAPVGEAITGASETLGDTAFEWTGSPELAAIAYSVPTAVLEAVGFKGISTVGKQGTRFGEKGLRAAQTKMLKDPELKYHEAVADVKINNKGVAVPDKMAEKLLKQDLNRNDVSVITNSDVGTKSGMAKMLNEFEKAQNNSITSMQGKTTAVIGDSIGKRLSAAQGMRKRLGKSLDNMVKGELGDTPVSVKDAVQTATQALRAEGVNPTVKMGKVVLPRDWAAGTVFDLPQMASAKKAMESSLELVDMRSGFGGKTDLRNAHKLKKNLDDLVDATKLQDSGVSSNMTRTITNMRKSVNDSISSQVPEYGRVNAELSGLIKGMDPFSKHLRQGETWASARASSVAGQAAKSLNGPESGASASLIKDLGQLDSALRTARILPTDDPKALVAFRDILKKEFTMSAKIPEAGAGDALTGLATSVSVGNVFGAAHDIKRLIEAGMKRKDAVKFMEQRQKTMNMIKAAVNQKPQRSSTSLKNITITNEDM